MGKGSFELALVAYTAGWIPISILVGIIVTILGWDDAYLLTLVITTAIFLIIVVPLVEHLEKKSKKF